MSEVKPHFPDDREFKVLTEKYPSLLQALDAIAGGFTGLFSLIEQKESSKTNDLLYLLVGAAYTEFEEILVLGLNGYGSGATKLLRALYERTVTAQYLMKNPDKTQQFMDFSHVHWHTLLEEADKTGAGKNLSKKRREEITSSFKEVEATFTQGTRLRMSWIKESVPKQASAISKTLGFLSFHGYLMPTFFLHTTFWGIERQIRQHGNGKSELHNREVELGHATRTIVIACNLMAHLSVSINKYYKLKAGKDCKSITEAVNRIGLALIGSARPKRKTL